MVTTLTGTLPEYSEEVSLDLIFLTLSSSNTCFFHFILRNTYIIVELG